MKANISNITSPRQIIKRDGTLVPFDYYKIRQAIAKANATVPSETLSDAELDQLTADVVSRLQADSKPAVEAIQDLVEVVLMENNISLTAKAYILYRSERTRQRREKNALMETFKDISFADAPDRKSTRLNSSH